MFDEALAHWRRKTERQQFLQLLATTFSGILTMGIIAEGPPTNK